MRKLKWEIAQRFELLWWKQYLRSKDKETYLNWKKNYWNNLLQYIAKWLTITDSMLIADFGCGPAGVFIVFPKNRIIAVDPLIDAYEYATPFFKKTDYPNVHFIKSTIENFTSEKKFDVVFCMNAINHVCNIEQAFGVLAQSVGKSGKIILSVDAHNYSILKHLFRFIPGDVLHPHQYSLKDYECFLQKHGITVLKTIMLKRGLCFSHFVIVAQQ